MHFKELNFIYKRHVILNIQSYEMCFLIYSMVTYE